MREPTADRLAALEQRVAALEDIEAIKRLQADYAAACDDGYNPDLVANQFTENGVWDGGELGRVEGREAIRDFFSKTSEKFLFAVHFMISPNIELSSDGETARGSWYLWEPCTIREDERSRQYWAATVYDIIYRKVDKKWLFEFMHLDVRIFTPIDVSW